MLKQIFDYLALSSLSSIGKKIILVGGFAFLLNYSSFGQTEKELRLNLINPGIVWENPIGTNKTIELNLGIGYNGSYPELNTEYGENGFQGQLAPFLDVQARSYYNIRKIAENGRRSRNFIALRYLFYGPRIAGNVRTNENYSMAVGPTWGFKKVYEKWTVLGSLGPIYYFDLTGTGGIFPINFEFNLGYRLK
ncbi:hypothetical protein [Algoriphagus boseongensis]|uniref:hypothetical protein n=1 Tax=Algoriphagus boseongensis TaxID=1442587 RepID=UPI00105DFD78|nr:hypothetical protein [Algoriphagus boseongensis]